MNKKIIVSSLSLIGFIIITILVLINHTNSFDNYVYKIISSMKSDFFDNFFKIITKLGNTLPVIIIVIILLMILDKKDQIILGSCTITTLIINQLLKHIIKRPRPPIIERLITQGGYSYPSGHSMISMCLYGTLIYVVYKNISNKIIKYSLMIILSLLIILIGISRIYVRVHYPSDVLAGFLLTIVILIITITIINNYFRGDINDKNSNK